MFRKLTVILAITFMALAYGGAKAQEVVDSEARATATQAQQDAALAEQGVSDVSGGLIALQQVVADLQAAVTAGLAALQTALQTQIDALGAAIGPAAVSAVSVDCVLGENIADAVALATPGTPLTVTFEGTCVENVSIDVDDITLAGLDATDHTLSILQGQVTVSGAQRVVIENATITSSVRGVIVTRGAVARLRNLTITNHSRDGVLVNRGSSASLDDMTITNNRDGVRVNRNSSATIDNLTIKDNTRRGVSASQGSSVQIVNNTMITENGERGLALFRSSHVSVNNSTIMLNKRRDVDLLDGSGVRIENSFIGPRNLASTAPDVIRVEFSNLRLSDVAVDGDVTLISHARLEGSGETPATSTTIVGNVQLSRDSLLTHKFSQNNPFTVTGNVTCSTSQSGLGVVSGDFAAGGFSDGLGLDILGAVDPNCTLMDRLIGPQ